MKKVAALLIILGSGLTAFGFAGWQALGKPAFMLPGVEGELGWDFTAGWPLHSQLEITIGITLLACGMMLRGDSK